VSARTIAFFLPSLDGGGTERVFVQLANEFVTLGVRVDVVLATASGPYLDELSPDVRVVDLDTSGVMQALPRLARYLRTERPEAMLSGLDHANVVAILACVLSRKDTRCVISMRSVPTAVYRANRSVRGWILLRLMRITYRFADGIVVNSEGVGTGLSQLIRAPVDNLNVIYNPLNIPWIDALGREALDHPWCADGAPPVILGVGRLDVLKDFPTLINAFLIVRSRRDCRLVILGEGPDRDKLEILIRDLHLQSDVYLPGFVSNPFAWMRRAQVFVSSSLTEGCPNAIMQSLACETPVVATDCVGGSREILEDGQWGRMVEVGNAGAMAVAIEATLDTAHDLDLRRRADDFSHDRIACQYLRVLLPKRSRVVTGSRH
jgi:glycosyltransferase involved in cell wall biosynthesis